jgi:hypothetical protein
MVITKSKQEGTMQSYSYPAFSSSLSLDDSSITSTIDIAEANCGSLPLKSSSPTSSSSFKKRQTKSVRFNEQDNQVYEVPGLTNEEDCKTIWYQAHEYNHFKISIKNQALEFAKLARRNNIYSPQPSYRGVLKQIYEACAQCTNEAITGDKNNDINTTMTSMTMEVIADEEMATIRWLGLERSAIPDIAEDRRSRRSLVTRTVLQVQKESALFGGSWGGADASADESLRRASEEVTRTSRLFALCLGQQQTLTAETICI